MDKKYYSPLELLQIATQHVYAAEQLLTNDLEISVPKEGQIDSLAPFSTLMVLAFELMLKAYLSQQFHTTIQHKNLVELLEFSTQLGLSKEEELLLKKLSRQFGFRKGVDYELWESREQTQIFCTELITLYERLQELMPLELHEDYQGHG